MSSTFTQSVMKVRQGDLVKLALNGDFDVIIHGCNCECAMNGGIAKQIKNTFPDAYQADQGTKPCDPSKMGSFSYAKVKLRSQKRLIIVNGYTQLLAGGQVNYVALRTVMQHVKQNFYGTRIGYPKIGSGLAGGDWVIIEDIINEELKGEDHTLVEFLVGSKSSSNKKRQIRTPNDGGNLAKKSAKCGSQTSKQVTLS